MMSFFSTNMIPFLPAPGKTRFLTTLGLLMHSLGADDDGSGSVTILEAFRALLDADFHPVRTVEFHWYSAEVRHE
jgi:leucyl aminopeptidase